MGNMILLPGDGLPVDGIPTARVQHGPTVREQAEVGLRLGVMANNWIKAHENLIAAMARLVTRLCDHVQSLEERLNLPENERLKQQIDAEAKAAVAAVQEKLQQPPPQGDGLRDYDPAKPLNEQVGEGDQLLIEHEETGGRRWAKMNEPLLVHEVILKIGPKPPTQGIGLGGKIPRLSDPDVPAPAIEQPPEKPA